MTTTGPTPAPALRGERPYKVPRHPAPIDLWLHANEGPPPPAALYDALAARGPELLQRYPAGTAAVEAALAERLGVAPTRVLVTAGGDDALDRAFRAFLWPGREVVLPVPTFVMLERYARLAGATVRTIPWPGGPWPLDAALAAIGPDTGAVAVVSPNNPTGAVITGAALRELAAAAPGAAILCDLAYAEFADEDLTAVALELDNALVFRTLSKAWGLAGARVGYVVGPEPLVAVLRAAGNPYSVSAPSAALALAHLASGEPQMARYCDRVRAERGALRGLLVDLGVDCPESQGNFVLARFRAPARALWLRDALAALGIGVRAFPGEPHLEDAVRVTCPGDAAALDRVLRAVRAALAPTALIVDDLFALEAVDGAAAWFFSADPAALAAARAMGAVPIALDPAPESAPAALQSASARVVPHPDALEEVLP
ncbi:MAG: histidinol-phosphate aminotransferase family protein [Myxococcales bacterium]|nr:histidinol-phosphate aminotransferase family protein [Myxococcales bacterium]MCB9735905.1 histidinol-phosphate aminotransferase family protein [Deltaproteobacteria bacterium]